MMLHMPTFHVVFASVALVAVLALVTEWRRGGGMAVVNWTAAYVVVATMEMISILGGGGEFWEVAASPAMRLLALSLMANGSLVFVGRRASLLPFLVPAAWLLIWALRWKDLPLSESGGERQAVAALSLAVLCATISLLFRPAPATAHYERFLSIVFGLHAVVVSIRILFAGVISMAPGMEFRNTISTLFLVEAMVFVSAISYLFTGAVKERALGRWREAARFDSLTGALTRQAFLEAVARARRSSPFSTLAMIDLDHFKSINDTHGHAVGDEALRIFARTVTGAVGDSGTLGRLGGEEFAVVLAGDRSAATARLARALDAFARSAEALLHLPRPVTASAGIVECDAASSIEDLLVQADDALYRAKRNGRNRIEAAVPAALAAESGAPSPPSSASALIGFPAK